MRTRTAPIVALLLAASLLTGMDGRCEAEASSGLLQRAFPRIELQLPVWMEQAPGQSEHWYVVQQRGTIVRFENKANASETRVVLDIRDRVKYGGERGLLGLAFHPRFASNGHVFVNYTTTLNGKLETRISRFTSKNGGDAFDASSELILLSFEQTYSNHNGGQVSFGPDGYLYVGVGDGGSAGDPKNDAQNTNTLLGTLLRIDVDKPTEGKNYGIPADNPFVNGGGRPEIYAWGLRNPWRFSWDPKTGKLWVGDVGQNAWEEIDVVERGKNYGWRVREGRHCYKPENDCPTADLVDPVIEYGHDLGQSVTGGYVYRGAIDSLAGRYIYGDFVSGRIWAWDLARKKNTELARTSHSIASFARDLQGELYLLDYGPGAVYKFVGPKTK